MATKLTKLRVTHISLVDRGANKRDIVWKSADAGTPDVAREIKIAKTDAEQRIVYGVVYAPDDVDSQGEYATADEIRKAAYEFMSDLRGRNIDKQHDFQNRDAYVAESWLVRKGDELFPDEPVGTWAVAIKVEDDSLWEAVKEGKIGGLSMAGTAKRVPDHSTAKSAEGLIGQFFTALLKHLPGHESPESEGEDEMNAKDLEKALEKGLAPINERLDRLEKGTGSDSKDKKDGELTVDGVVKAIESATKPLTERLDKLEKAAPGSGQGTDDHAGDDADRGDEALMKAVEAMNKAR